MNAAILQHPDQAPIQPMNIKRTCLQILIEEIKPVQINSNRTKSPPKEMTAS